MAAIDEVIGRDGLRHLEPSGGGWAGPRASQVTAVSWREKDSKHETGRTDSDHTRGGGGHKVLTHLGLLMRAKTDTTHTHTEAPTLLMMLL